MPGSQAFDERAAGLPAERRELLELWLGREAAAVAGAYSPPRTAEERELAGIWADVLEVERVGIDDDYFQLGGDSILAIVVVARLQEAGLVLSTQDLFDTPTIRDLAVRLTPADPAAGQPGTPPFSGGEPGGGPDPGLPLTPLQAGMLFHSLSDPAAYVVQVSCRLDGDVDTAELAQAWQAAVDRHPELRTRFQAGPDEPRQTFAPAAAVPIELIDWRSADPEGQAEAIEQYLERDRRRGFDPAVAPLLRIALIRLAPAAYQFVLTHHHLILDGWSQQLVLDELLRAYDAMKEGNPVPPVERLPFSSYLDWLGRQDLEAAEAFWRRELNGFVPVPVQDHGAGQTGGYGLLSTTLTPEASGQLTAFARRHGCTLGTIVQAGWALALAELSGTDDVALGVTLSGRPAELPGVTEALGMYINTLPVRARIPAGAGLLDWLHSVQRTQADLARYQYTPLTLVERWGSGQPGTHLFDSIVVVENFPVSIKDPHITRRLRVSGATARVEEGYPLVLEARPSPRLRLSLRYDLSRIGPVSAQALLAGVTEFAAVAAAGPPEQLSDMRGHLAGVMAGLSAAVHEGRRSALRQQLRTARRQAVPGSASEAGP